MAANWRGCDVAFASRFAHLSTDETIVPRIRLDTLPETAR